MKRLTRLLAPALLTAALLAGCSDSGTPADPASTGGDSYFPLTKGSSWTYRSVGAPAPLDYTVTITGDTSIGGVTYQIAQSTASTGTSYARRDGSSYYALAATTPSQPTLFLKDAPAGATWSFDASAANGTVNHYDYTLAEMGLTKTVEGKTYTDVIRAHLKSSIDLLGQKYPVSEGDYYYAKNVGLIQTDLGALGVISLTSYTVK